jgi:hypothetical protein
VSDSQDEEFAFRFDATREFNLDMGQLEIQGGVRGRFREKAYNADIDFYEADDLTLADFLGAPSYGLAEHLSGSLPNRFRPYFFNGNFADFERADLDSEFDSLVSDYEVKKTSPLPMRWAG